MDCSTQHHIALFAGLFKTSLDILILRCLVRIDCIRVKFRKTDGTTTILCLPASIIEKSDIGMLLASADGLDQYRCEPRGSIDIKNFSGIQKLVDQGYMNEEDTNLPALDIDCEPVSELMVKYLLTIYTLLPMNSVESFFVKNMFNNTLTSETSMTDVYNFCEFIGYNQIDALSLLIWNNNFPGLWHRVIKSETVQKHILKHRQYFDIDRCKIILAVHEKSPTEVQALMINIALVIGPIIPFQFTDLPRNRLNNIVNKIKASSLYQKINVYYTLMKFGTIDDPQANLNQKLDDKDYIFDLAANTPLSRFINQKLKLWFYDSVVLDVCGTAIDLFRYNFDDDYYDEIRLINPTIDKKYKMYPCITESTN